MNSKSFENIKLYFKGMAMGVASNLEQEDLDDCIGLLLDKIEELGIEENT
ncbi:MAG: hypothetical protein H8E16_01450, partial [Flavobacteriales bacterium]|nr:hypothetical protein [Flavobacteriales bacterium]